MVFALFCHLRTVYNSYFIMLRTFIKDLSLSAAVAGLIVVLVGFTSTVAIVFQAARALGASPDVMSSWIWALGIGMGGSCIGLSLYYRKPVVTAWSTPGAALLATSEGFNLADATGAFVLCAVLITLAGLSGAFDKLMKRIPIAIATAMLAGLLLRFGLGAFAAIKVAPVLVLSMCAMHLLGRRFWPRYGVLGVLLCGVLIVYFQGALHTETLSAHLAAPVWTTPHFTLAAMIGLGLPLFVVTMTSQNAAGVAAIRAAGYDTPTSPLISCTGISTLLLAPFGAFALNLAAITAAIAMSSEAHPDPNKRYVAGVFAGLFYVLTGVFGAAISGLFAAFPAPMIAALAGLALLGTIANNLTAALKQEQDREAGLITFLITASGLSLFGIGSAFWGLIGGVLASVVLRKSS
jgi:benzoate membrane transport protein